MAFALLFSACKRDHFPCDCRNGGVPTVKVFATGLNSPRGLRFGPDGNLYVAEAGTGGTNSTVGSCDQVPFPVGLIQEALPVDAFQRSIIGERVALLQISSLQAVLMK